MIKFLDSLGDIHSKPVLVRCDLNLPFQDGLVSDTTRAEATAPTIKELADKGAVVLILAHFGRPGGQVIPEMSLRPVAAVLEKIVKRPVQFMENCVGQEIEARCQTLAPGSIVLLENTRFHPGEKKNDPDLAQQMARLGSLYVNDAFSCAHRAHASTHALAKLLPAYAGRSMERELSMLTQALGDPKRPVLAIIGGAKVSTKIDVLLHLVTRLDHLMIGGGMANSFLYALDKPVGSSFCEKDLAPTVLEIMEQAQASGCQILLPEDVVVTRDSAPGSPNRTIDPKDVKDDEIILDLGPQTISRWKAVLKDARTCVWNGPLGTFETPPFDQATVDLAKSVAELTKDSRILSVAGGGDTVAALNHAGVTKDFSFISTAGGAFLEWLEGKSLPGVTVLDS